jgi:hypothetical protein
MILERTKNGIKLLLLNYWYLHNVCDMVLRVIKKGKSGLSPGVQISLEDPCTLEFHLLLCFCYV